MGRGSRGTQTGTSAEGGAAHAGRRSGSRPDAEARWAPARIPDVGPYGGSLEAAAGHWFAAGGCAHLALAFKTLFPDLKIAVDWYSDDGRKTVGHAVAYDPSTGRSFDVYGTGHVDSHLPMDPPSSLGVEKDVDPQQLAEHMNITWSPESPWSSDGVSEGADFIREHFGVPW